MEGKGDSPILRPDFAKAINEYSDIVDLAGTHKRHIAGAINHALTTMRKVWTREQRAPLLNWQPCGFLMVALSAEAAEIIRMVMQDAAKAFPQFRLEPWEKHRYRPAWRCKFMGKHWITVAIVPGKNAKTPYFGKWQLGGKD